MGDDVVKMKRGDYSVHVYIEQAKDIKMDEGHTVDPLVQLTCLGEKKHTKSLKGISSVARANWNEHVFFEPKGVEEDRLEHGTLEISVMDKGFFSDAMLAYYEFDVTQIYGMKDHALMHTFIVMSNPEGEEFGEVTCNLKLSITIAGAEDTPVPIEDDPNPSKEVMLQPPEIKPEFYQLYIRIFAGQNILPLDANLFDVPSVDAYVRFDYRSKKLKTKVLKQVEGGQVHWNQ